MTKVPTRGKNFMPVLKHFAILRGIKEDRVFLNDPSRGIIHI
jgi:predicted double-glycine peptidase